MDSTDQYDNGSRSRDPQFSSAIAFGTSVDDHLEMATPGRRAASGGGTSGLSYTEWEFKRNGSLVADEDQFEIIKR
jgi:hypothetical protein